MRVFITGVRHNAQLDQLEYLICQLPLEITTVVTSDRTGVEAWARSWATYNDKALEVIPTLWQTHHRHACRMRNAAAIERAQACIVFMRRDCSYSASIVERAMNWSKPLFTRCLD